jgi:dynein assembly factor 1
MSSTVAVLEATSQKTTEKQEREIQHSDALPRMTPELLQSICKERHMWTQPHLNTQLFLNYKGFLKIEGLEDYINIKSLHLDNNNIAKIECLERMTELKTLHLAGNRIAQIENLEFNVDLRHLNLESNPIRRPANLQSLLKLETLNLASNQIEHIDDLSELRVLPSLINIDVSNNSIESAEGVVEFWTELKKLKVLRYHGNPGIRHIEHYRKRIINGLPQLSYMDERPIFPVERKTCLAWAEGGLPAMQQARRDYAKIRQAECGVDPERKEMLTKRRQLAIERLDREEKEREAKRQQEQENQKSNIQGAADPAVQAGDENALEAYADSWHQKASLYGEDGLRERVAKEEAETPKQKVRETPPSQREHSKEFDFAPPVRHTTEQSELASVPRADHEDKQIVPVSGSLRQRGAPATVADFRDSKVLQEVADLHIAAYGDGDALPNASRPARSSGQTAARQKECNDGQVMPLIWQQRQQEVCAAEAACLEQNMVRTHCGDGSVPNPAAFKSSSAIDGLGGLD